MDNLFNIFDTANSAQLQLIKDRMRNKMEYARSLSTKEDFTKELAKGFIEIYRSLMMDEFIMDFKVLKSIINNVIDIVQDQESRIREMERCLMYEKSNNS